MLLAVAACSGGDLMSVIESARDGAELQSGQAREEGKMRLTSTAFEPGAEIPRRFTCDGRDVSPPLALHDVPPEARSLVLIMDDPDAPGGTWDHWITYDIPVTHDVPEGVAALGTAGRNSWGRTGYGGPCPPRGTHRYVFSVYALDSELGLAQGADKAAVLKAISGHVLAEARLTGRYARSGG
jgi:Raf kinase inhibitor-like YbhB/YbcL family protein